MTHPTRRGAWALAFAIALPLAAHTARADDTRTNRGSDPFFQVSKAIANCPVPLGPLETEQEWLDEAHYRIERGNSCWLEGRCRLPNGYLYDKDIAEAVQRRLSNINYATQWRDHTTLWLTLQRRFIYVEGCVSADFDKQKFLDELAKTAEVERVIDHMTTDPKGVAPYKTVDGTGRVVEGQ